VALWVVTWGGTIWVGDKGSGWLSGDDGVRAYRVRSERRTDASCAFRYSYLDFFFERLRFLNLVSTGAEEIYFPKNPKISGE
jgi:hypothetical protein